MTGASQDLRALQGDGRYARVRATGLKPGDMFRPVDQALRFLNPMEKKGLSHETAHGRPVELGKTRLSRGCPVWMSRVMSRVDVPCGEPSKFTKRTLVHLGGYSFSGHAESVVQCPFQNPGPAGRPGPGICIRKPVEAARIGMLTNGTDGTYAWEIYNLHTVCMPSVATQTVQSVKISVSFSSFRGGGGTPTHAPCLPARWAGSAARWYLP
eukprot:gene25763-biopygen19522